MSAPKKMKFSLLDAEIPALRSALAATQHALERSRIQWEWENDNLQALMLEMFFRKHQPLQMVLARGARIRRPLHEVMADEDRLVMARGGDWTWTQALSVGCMAEEVEYQVDMAQAQRARL